MSETLGSGPVDLPPVLGRSLLSHRASKPGHDKDRGVPHQRNSRHDAVHNEVAASIQPWGDAEVDGKGQGVSDDDASRDHLACQLGIAADSVVERTGNGQGRVDGQGELGKGQSEPVEVIGDGEAVKDHAGRDENAAESEEVEGVLWFGNSAVAASQLDGKYAANLAAVKTSVTPRVLVIDL